MYKESTYNRLKNRAEMNDAVAIFNLGHMPQNRAKALKLWHRAGELGNADPIIILAIAI